jgi:hypothetical protein
MAHKTVIVKKSDTFFKAAGALLALSGIISLFYLQIFPMPSGIITSAGLLFAADRTTLYNSVLFYPYPLLWSAALIGFGAAIFIKKSQKLCGIAFLIFSAMSLLAALMPMPSGGIDKYFNAVYIQGFSAFIVCLLTGATVLSGVKRILPAKIIGGMFAVFEVYLACRTIHDRFYLIATDVAVVFLLIISAFLILFSLEKERYETVGHDYFEEDSEDEQDT